MRWPGEGQVLPACSPACGQSPGMASVLLGGMLSTVSEFPLCFVWWPSANLLLWRVVSLPLVTCHTSCGGKQAVTKGWAAPSMNRELCGQRQPGEPLLSAVVIRCAQL